MICCALTKLIQMNHVRVTKKRKYVVSYLSWQPFHQVWINLQSNNEKLATTIGIKVFLPIKLTLPVKFPKQGFARFDALMGVVTYILLY